MVAVALLGCGGGAGAGSRDAANTSGAGTGGAEAGAGSDGSDASSPSDATLSSDVAPSDAPPDVPSETNGDASLDPRVNVDLVWKGAGCGKPAPTTAPVVAGFSAYHVMTTGVTLDDTIAPAFDQKFWVRVPKTYDVNRAYRTVYLFPGCSANAYLTTYPLYDETKGGSDDAIYIAVEADINQRNCFDNDSGPASREWEAFALMHQVVDAAYCVDGNRVFAVGYAGGGTMASDFGCVFGGMPTPPRKLAPNTHIRGAGDVAGVTYNFPCSGPAAGLWIGISDGPRYAVLTNGCSGSPTVPWGSTPAISSACVRYTECPRQYPVINCATPGQGNSSQESLAIPAFTEFFKLMDP
jgi:hypothetical protein